MNNSDSRRFAIEQLSFGWWLTVVKCRGRMSSYRLIVTQVEYIMDERIAMIKQKQHEKGISFIAHGIPCIVLHKLQYVWMDTRQEHINTSAAHIIY